MFAFGVLDYGLTTRALAAANLTDTRGLFGALVVSKSIALLGSLAVALAVTAVMGLDVFARLLVVVSVLAAAGDALGDTSLSIQQGEKRTIAANTLLLTRRLLALVPFAFGLTFEAAIVCLLVGGLIGVVACFALLFRRAGRPTSLPLLLRSNHTMFLAGLGPNLSQLGTAVVGATSGAVLAGLYGASTRLAAPMNLVITTLMQVFVPEMAGEGPSSRRLAIFKGSRRVALVLAAVFLAAVPASPWVTQIVLGDEFRAAAPIIGGVIAAAALIAVSQTYLGWFYATSVPLGVGVSMIASALLRLFLCAFAGYLWGAWGLAVTLPLVAIVTLVSLHLIWLRQSKDIERHS